MGCCSCGNPKSGRVWLVIAFVCIVLAAGLMIGGLTGPYYKIASKASFGNLSAKSTTLYTGSKIKYEGQGSGVSISVETKMSPKFKWIAPIHGFIMSFSFLAWFAVIPVVLLQMLLLYSMFKDKWPIAQGPLRTLILGLGAISVTFIAFALFNYAANLKYAFIAMCQEKGMGYGVNVFDEPTPSGPAPAPGTPPPPPQYCNSRLAYYAVFWGSNSVSFGGYSAEIVGSPGAGYWCASAGAVLLLISTCLHLCVSPNGCMCCISKKK